MCLTTKTVCTVWVHGKNAQVTLMIQFLFYLVKQRYKFYHKFLICDRLIWWSKYRRWNIFKLKHFMWSFFLFSNKYQAADVVWKVKKASYNFVLKKWWKNSRKHSVHIELTDILSAKNRV